ncbi:MAG: alpha/beta hydrolase [Rikenellaceae bacterium]
MTYQYKGLNINIDLRGEGAEDSDGAILLLHGWGCDNNIFDSCRGYLAQKYRLYTFDLPGFGASSEPNSVWGTQDYVDMLRVFIIDNSIVKPILMGHSFGGRVSILYASQFEVSKIILIDAAGVVPRRSMNYYLKVYTFKFIRTICQALLPKTTAQRVIDKWRGNAGSSDYNNASPMMRAILSKVVNEDLKGDMPNILAPTLIFWGDKDTATPISDGRIMEKLIPDAGLVVASGAGHYSFLESRGLFDAVVKNFLNIK